MLLFLLDIHRNILSAQGFLKCSTTNISNVEIVIKHNNLCISFNENTSFRCFSLLIPEHFLIPSTVSSVLCNSSKEHLVTHDQNGAKLNFPLLCDAESSVNKENQELEITFRLQVSNNSVMDNYITGGTTGNDFKDFVYAQIKEYKTCGVICTECGTPLTENATFHSVSKYYEGLSELAESWFCHKHDDQDCVKIHSNSLYIGDLYFYCDNSVVKSFRVSESNKEIRCLKCSSILSWKKKMENPHYIGFFSDKIMLVQSKAESNDIRKYKIDSALFSLCSIIKDLMKSAISCKLYLQAKVGQTTEVLLLWINSQKVVQFLLHALNDEEIPLEEDFKAKEVYKVLYCSCPFDSELSKKWKHDFGVEFYQISDNMMNVVKECLGKSSKYFPKEQEIKGFSFGYLPTNVSL